MVYVHTLYDYNAFRKKIGKSSFLRKASPFEHHIINLYKVFSRLYRFYNMIKFAILLKTTKIHFNSPQYKKRGCRTCVAQVYTYNLNFNLSL